VSDLELYARLAAGAALIVLPGWLIGRALGLRGPASAVAWTFASLFLSWGATFALRGEVEHALVIHGAFGLVALPFAIRKRRHPGQVPHLWAVGLAGIIFGVALWRVAGAIGGDGLFHLARVRKLLAFDDLSLHAVNEFADGGLHPGYAFPLWHCVLASVAKVASVDPADAILHGPSVLAPLALAVAFEAGWLLFRSVSAAAVATAAQVALIGLSPAHGGAYTALALPATGSRQLLAPAVLALAFRAIDAPTPGPLASAAVASLAIAVVHPTYAMFLWLPFLGFLLVRWLWTRSEASAIGGALLVLVVPAAAYFVWLLPVIRDTASVSPGPSETARGLQQYAGQLDVWSDSLYRLAPEVFGRSGVVAVAALLLLPLAGLAARTRWAAFVVGGSLVTFALLLVPWLFTPFAELVSLSQARRAAGFLPFAFAFAGGLGVLARLLGLWLLPVALVSGAVFQLLWPGDFDYRLTTGGPALAVWIAVAGGLAALVYGAFRRRHVWAPSAAAAALFLVAVTAHAVANWTPNERRRPIHLTDGLIAAVRELVPERGVVFSDLETSYRLAAFAPVYVVANPPSHVADTVENRPYERRADVVRFFKTGKLAIPQRYGAGWLVIDRDRFPDLEVRAGEPSYRDERFELYRL
jgi:hypothetical protein